MCLMKKKMGIDLGNSNMKAVGGIERDLKYDTIRSLASENSTDTNNVVIYNNKQIHFGTGMELCAQDKVNRKYIEESILLCAYKLFGPGFHDIDLALGLPIKTYKSQKKDTFQERLSDIHKLEGVVNAAPITVNIRRRIICAEGYSAFLALNKEFNKSEPILLVDHGYRTTDMVALSFYNGKWHIDGHHTIGKGLREIYEEMSTKLLDIDIDLQPNEIEYRLMYAPIFNNEARTDLRSYYKICTNQIEDIYNQIYLKFTDAPTRTIYLVGGGAEGVSHMIERSNIYLPSNDKLIYANAVGFYLQL